MKENVNLNERSSASQKALILAHLKAGNSLTSVQALYVTPKENRNNPLTVLNHRRRFGPHKVTEQFLF